MINFILRHRTGLTFIATVLVLLSLVAGQVPTPEHQSVLVWAVYAVISPVEQAISHIIIGAGGLWSDYVDLRNVRSENKVLRQEVARLHRENQQLKEKVRLSESLFALEQYRETFELVGRYRTLTAMVAGAGAGREAGTILLNRGTIDGIEVDQGVICPTGVVGKVIRVGPTSCLVQLVTDPLFAMAVRLQRNRLRGLLHGTGNTECDLLYIRDNDSVKTDDLVISSGLERIFPIGLPVGTVVRIEEGEPPFRRVFVLPSADFRSLEWVLIVVGVQENPDDKEVAGQ